MKLKSKEKKSQTKPKPEVTKIYVTFGRKDAHMIKGELIDGNCVAVINCKLPKVDLRREMKDVVRELFDVKYSVIRTEDEWKNTWNNMFSRGLIQVEV